MTFIDDNGNQLEFGGEFAMTKQAVSFFNGSVTGDVSINFSVDNNSVNRKVLNYYGPQMTGQVAWTKQAFNRMRNGNIIDRGYIVIQSDYGDSLSCFYVSGNSNWVQLLQGLITELDFSGVTNGKDYTQVLNYTNVDSRKSTTDGIIFPLVDWRYGGKQLSNKFWMVSSTETSLIPTIIDLYPCFYLKSLVIEIANQNGLKLSGNLFDDSLYNSIVISPVNGQMKRADSYNITAFGGDQIIVGFIVKYTSFNTINDNTGFFSYTDQKYTSDKNQLISLQLTDLLFAASNVYLYKNGAYLNDFGFGPGIIPFDTPYELYLNRGDVLEIYTDTVATVRFNLIIKVPEIIDVNDSVSPAHFLPSFKSIDVIKFVINYFGCVSTFNEYSKTITCNIVEKINTESAYDWSEYSISSTSEYTVNQAQNNYIRLSTDNNDKFIGGYNKKHEVNFGEGNIETGNTLKANNDLYKIPFAPSYSVLTKDNVYYLPVIPLVTLVLNETRTFTSITNMGSGVSRFNGMSAGSFIYTEMIEVLDASNISKGYFLVSQFATTTTSAIFDFVSSYAGTIRTFNIQYNQVQPRLLSVKPNTNLVDFTVGLSSFSMGNSPLTYSSYTSCAYAAFTKEKVNDTIDQWKNNLAIDNPDSGGFTDPTIKQLYFNKISKFLQNPNIRAKMLLPESVYQSFVFDQFIYLRTENLTGYFFVDSIVNYIDGNTPCEVNLYML